MHQVILNWLGDPVLGGDHVRHDHLTRCIAMDQPRLECIFGVEGDTVELRQSTGELLERLVIGRG